ncbi:MAG: GumC domain-containing protein [Planctomycetota bacterium]|jgi:hypothetical protein
MSRKQIIFLFIILNLAICSEVLCAPWSSQKYKAEALIRVLPYVDRDPLTFEMPPIDKDTQYIFRNSMATLMRRKSFLKKLVQRDKVQETNWFRSIPEDQVIRFQEAVKNLEKSFTANVRPDIDFIQISFICEDKIDAGVIVDQIVDLFVNTQNENQKRTIMERLNSLTNRRDQVQKELETSQRVLEQVRQSLPRGYVNLDLYSYSHPVFIRLNRLQEQQDNLTLEIIGQQATITHMEKNEEDTKEVDYKLMILRAKYEELDKKRVQAVKEKEDYSRAKTIYDSRKKTRGERQAMLDSIRKQIDKLRIVADDPSVSKLQSMGPAEVFPVE